MALPNSENILSRLAKLPDQALKQMAMMHKADPYILPLIISEDGRRKQLRQAAQGQMAQMQQPKVADAAVAQMGVLPEEQGIAQLPTPNIQGMADGGIAGYDDTDFNFAQQREPVVRMSGGGHIPRYQGVPKPAGDGSVVSSNPMFNIPNFQAVQPRADFTQEGAPENTPFFQRVANSIKEQGKEATLFEIESRIKRGIATPEEKEFFKNEKLKSGDTAATDVKYPPQDAIRTKNFPGVKPGFELMPADADANKKAADKTPPGAKPADAGGVRDLLPAPPKLDTRFKPAAAPTADAAVAESEKIFNSKARIANINRQVLQEQMDAESAKENSIAALAAFNKKQGPAYAGYEQILKKEELQDATDKEKAGLMSLMKGFLAMAAGESPNAATNIAKGAMVGMGDYGDALKEFKKAAKERNKELQFIEQARRSEERGDFDKVQMYTDKADTARQASTRFGITAVNAITDAGGKASSDILQNMRAITSSENIAGAQEAGRNTRFIAEQAGLNARAAYSENKADKRALLPTGDARTAILLGSGNTDAERLRSGMGVLQELSADKTGMAAFKILGEINAKNANDPNFKPLTLADLTAFQRDFQRNTQAGPKNVSDKPTGKVLD